MNPGEVVPGIHYRSSKLVEREYMSKEYVVVDGIYKYGIEPSSSPQHSLIQQSFKRRVRMFLQIPDCGKFGRFRILCMVPEDTTTTK